MAKLTATTGYFQNGMPYARFGSGSRDLVILGGGPDFTHKPPSGLILRMMLNSFRRFAEDYTVHYVSRKRGLPTDYSVTDIANDYATMIRDELRVPVDAIGLSSGGSYAQPLVAEHPDLVRRLVLAMSAYRLGDEAREVMRHVGDLARRGKWGAAYAAFFPKAYSSLLRKWMYKFLMWLLGSRLLGVPDSPSDGLVEIEAEDKLNFNERLREIKVPTLVIGGDRDFFYPADLFRETAAGIPDAKLIIYEGVGHMAMEQPQFAEDMLAFLNPTDK